MAINIEGKDLKHSLMGLVIALVEIIEEVLKHQAVNRMEGGSLTDLEIERLGETFMSLDAALEEIKEDHGVAESVLAVRHSLDGIADELLEKLLSPDKADRGLAGACPGGRE